MSLCPVMVLVPHLAKAICILGAPGRCHSLLHQGEKTTWDPQQEGCCVKTHQARAPGGKTEKTLSLPCSPFSLLCSCTCIPPAFTFYF